jgi:hypothetical protein
MRTLLCIPLLLAACAAAPSAVPRQSADTAWSDLRAKNPAGMEFSLRLADPHAYREGELIRVEIKFPKSDSPQPAEELWLFAGILLDPAGECGTMASPCPRPTNAIYDPYDPIRRIGTVIGPISASLNSSLPVLRPGRYRVALLARKQVLFKRVSIPPSSFYSYADPPQYAVSNAVEFEVAAATEEWLKRTIASSVAILSVPQGGSGDRGLQGSLAAEQLRFLDVPAAWSASLALLPTEANTLLRGLNATRDPARVCKLMQEAIPAPAQAVSVYYLSGMAGICARANLPDPPPVVPLKAGEQPPEPSAEVREYYRRRQEFEQDAMGKAASLLAASLTRKQGEAKVIALQTLMEQVRQSRMNDPRQPIPAWVPAVKQEFAKSYAALGWRQTQLLGLYASTLPSPDMIPLLESAMDAWKPGDRYEAPREALRDLYATDPARAQARIVAELAKPRTWLDSPQLDLLPVSAARFTDDELIAALDAAQRPGGWNPQLRLTALAKYANPKALPRVEALYESQRDSCQPELMAYFVRVEPEYADRVFHSHPWDVHVPAPPCTRRYFERTPQIAMGPVLERYMAAYLMQGDVPLKKLAAQSLGRYGSAAAEEPLWDAFRYFHEYWKGKQAELDQNGEGVYLEIELRNAIARGRNWLATESDLRTLESLCISERCRDDARQDLGAWQRPLRISVEGQPGSIRAELAQYREIESVEAMEEKVGQFPKGTEFVLIAHGDGADGAAARIRECAGAHGLTVFSR